MKRRARSWAVCQRLYCHCLGIGALEELKDSWYWGDWWRSLVFRHKHWENPFHIIYANISPAIKPICFCLGRSVKLGNMHCGIGCISRIIISHIDPKSKCSEFAQCIELPLIAVFPHRLMRLLQPAVVLVLLVEEIEGLVCCWHCLLLRCDVFCFHKGL